jgi:hypothetical protein
MQGRDGQEQPGDRVRLESKEVWPEVRPDQWRKTVRAQAVDLETDRTANRSLVAVTTEPAHSPGDEPTEQPHRQA